MSLRLTILGCGSSGGVPRVGVGWGACDASNPKNRRRRCSILVEQNGGLGSTFVLVDTSPDLRDQLLDAEVTKLDAVLYTHEHADHTHGIDDLRPLVIKMRKRMPVFADRITGELLLSRFSYCFKSPAGSQYPPILDAHLLTPGVRVTVEGDGGNLTALPFQMVHGDINALGFRFGNVAYAPDVSFLPEKAKQDLSGLDVLIIDALRHAPHPTHFSVGEALEAIAELKPKRSVLTNLHTDLDYDELRRQLPPDVEPAYDGMQIQV